ncbi:MAG: sugar nucleotide-binding protein, partial [Desulforhabdus sp.]|nr:sugar nucleotide-binding protein [Desulforhabdus sp.]
YGEHKVLTEQGMIARYPEVVVCRMPLMFGDAGPVASSFIQPMIRAMQKGRELRLFVDEFRTPISEKIAVQGIMLAIERAKGIIHLGGIERVSRYDFGRLLAEVAHFPDARLIPCRQQDIEMAAPRSADVSLDNAKAVALGFKPLPLKEDLEAWFALHRCALPGDLGLLPDGKPTLEHTDKFHSLARSIQETIKKELVRKG